MCECSTMARSPTGSRMADSQEVQGALQPGVSELEIRGADRGDEARVEGAGEPQVAMKPVPTEAQTDLVGPQLAGVKDPQHLDPGKRRGPPPPEILQRVI